MVLNRLRTPPLSRGDTSLIRPTLYPSPAPSISLSPNARPLRPLLLPRRYRARLFLTSLPRLRNRAARLIVAKEHPAKQPQAPNALVLSVDARPAHRLPRWMLNQNAIEMQPH